MGRGGASWLRALPELKLVASQEVALGTLDLLAVRVLHVPVVHLHRLERLVAHLATPQPTQGSVNTHEVTNHSPINIVYCVHNKASAMKHMPQVKSTPT